MKVGDNEANDRIAFDQIGHYEVSTILTSETWNGEPRYETVVFNKSKSTTLMDGPIELGTFSRVEEEFYCETLEEALTQHKNLLNKYRSTLKW